jgi:hypothetical protein
VVLDPEISIEFIATLRSNSTWCLQIVDWAHYLATARELCVTILIESPFPATGRKRHIPLSAVEVGN